MYRGTEGATGGNMPGTKYLSSLEILCGTCLIPEDLEQIRTNEIKKELVQTVLMGMHDPETLKMFQKMIYSTFAFHIDQPMSFLKILYALRNHTEWKSITGTRNMMSIKSHFMLSAFRIGTHREKMSGQNGDSLAKYAMKIIISTGNSFPHKVAVSIDLKRKPIPEHKRTPDKNYLLQEKEIGLNLILSAAGLWRLISSHNPSSLNFDELKEA